MDFLIVTGLSGAGKSLVVDALEDIGYYCVDNMPPVMILRFYRICLNSQEEFDKVAVVTDIRGGEPFRTLITDLEVLKVEKKPFKVLYINCSKHVLLNRYKETRRKHPLAEDFEGSLEKAVEEEIRMLEPAYKMSDYLIDTTELSPAQLKERVKEMFGGNVSAQMVIRVMSFGFKYGPNKEADLIFDVRCFPNPYYVPELKHHTGLESCVREYVMKDNSTMGFLSRLYDMIDYLLPLADVVTPNTFEAEQLAGMEEFKSEDDLLEAARKIHGLGAKNVVIKAARIFDNKTVDLLYDGTNATWLRGEKVGTSWTHGAGCSFSACITAELAKGKSVVDAVAMAREFVRCGLEHSFPLNQFVGPIYHKALSKYNPVVAGK